MSHSISYKSIAEKLIKSSEEKKYDPFNRVNYQAKLNHDRWQFPEQYLSLYHHPVYGQLSDEQKWKLSLLEAVNFFSMNVHGEQALVAGLESRLYRNKRVGEDAVSSKYIQRFIHEENSHTFMLAEYCIRYSGSLYPDHSLMVENPELSQETEDILFYGRIFTLENYLGYMNNIGQSDDELDQTARDIHCFHLVDELRHIAWDKAMIEENLFRAKEKGLSEELDTVKKLLRAYSEYIIHPLYNPAIYRELGLENGLALRQECFRLDARQKQIKLWTKDITEYFANLGL